MHKYHQSKVAKVSKNKFSPNICIILNAFSGLRRVLMQKTFHSAMPFLNTFFGLVLLVISAAFLLPSCMPSNRMKEGEKNKIVENVPFFTQESYQCGPASLASVMNYWDVKVSPEEIVAEIYSESAKGTLNIDMVLYPGRKGLTAEQYAGGIDDLKKNMDARYPLIVLVDYGFWVLQMNHFMVVIGYNENGVIVNSGKEQGKFIPEKDFVKIWGRTNFWTLRITKK